MSVYRAGYKNRGPVTVGPGCELVFRSLIALALRLPVGDSESGDYPGYSRRDELRYIWLDACDLSKCHGVLWP